MDSIEREQVALFRFGVIFPLLNETLQRGERSRLIDEICSKSYVIPFSERTVIARTTVMNWYYAYIKERDVKSLEPKDRADKGVSRTLDLETQNELVRRRKEHPNFTVKAIIRAIEKEGHKPISEDAAYRFLKDYDKKNPETSQKDRRRFEMENCNDLWMVDAMVLTDPLVKVEVNGETWKVKPRCFAFIDDKSRLITHAQFYADERTESLLDCMWKAMNKHGLPRQIYTDNGSAMRDSRLKRGLAELEVQLSYATAYTPQGKAKLERFWRTLRDQFVPTLPLGDTITLYELNKSLDEFIKKYNNSYHTGIGMSPSERYFNEVQAIRPAPMNLPIHFRTSEVRKVSAARTIQFNNELYEVPIGYAGQKIEIRYFNTSEIEAFYNGESIGFINKVDLTYNAKAHRHNEENKNGR